MAAPFSASIAGSHLNHDLQAVCSSRQRLAGKNVSDPAIGAAAQKISNIELAKCRGFQPALIALAAFSNTHNCQRGKAGEPQWNWQLWGEMHFALVSTAMAAE
ncbi:MAG: hypothetical protein ABSD59_09055 [Terracidiphilus sp.]|jgi:hypothetical protein